MKLATLLSSIVFSSLLTATMAAQKNGTLVMERRGSVPNSLDEAIQKSHLVVLIRVVSEQDKPRGKLAGTDFRAQVLEIFKKDAELSVGPEITIHRYGGLGDDNGTQIKFEERGFPLWRPGTTLVVFLGWMEAHKVFDLMSGPESTIEKDPSGNAKTVGRGRASREQHGKPFDEVLARLRSAVR